eukprot:NODE_8893_length_1462_cov_3.996255.p1 GENE.NODE_8893_length_1462_cov_3.996255~~NODE_8893_length_1462_cov_3.996255.p1  ORF type:complete len:331 (+),score=54.10 NODE_8893_length_1462_cov_3.996255:66-1058(+)
MLCTFKPNTYDPKDWQCPKPSCRAINFKKRTTCISCGAWKPDGTHRPLSDWRDGEKEQVAQWDCEHCRSRNEAGSYYCLSCKKPSTAMIFLMDEDKARRHTEEGRAGGLYDRQDPHDRRAWDSDGEEFDDFGRRKKQRGGGGDGGGGGGGADGGRSGSGGSRHRGGDGSGGRGGSVAGNGDSDIMLDARVGMAELRDKSAGRAAVTDVAASSAGGGCRAAALAEKHRAALERLKNKHAGTAPGSGPAGGGDDRDGPHGRDGRHGRHGRSHHGDRCRGSDTGHGDSRKEDGRYGNNRAVSSRAPGACSPRASQSRKMRSRSRSRSSHKRRH